ncbi:MAG: hypothetical protein OQL08_01700 [Gammaproteobacteria bacterium]|nr:hypothetical protein [Gammaproteobacteria bacterium]
MNAYHTAAQAAQAALSTAHADALADTQARLQHATGAASADAIRPRLLDMLEHAETPAADTVTSMLSTYAAMFAPHLQRDGEMMIRSLRSMKKQQGLTDAQCSAVAGSLLACIHGKAPSGLIKFPAPTAWHFNISLADLHQLAGWVVPDAHAELQAELDELTGERFKAERDLARLEAHKQALDKLAAALKTSPSNVMRIRSNAPNRQSVAGVFFEPGEVRELTPAEYGEIADHAGYRRMISAGQLEVQP